MSRFVWKSWLLLLYCELLMRFRSFAALNHVVRREATRLSVEESVPGNEELCRAMDIASVFYFKRVLCLQRSAATTLLLRRHGWHAEMVIGAQILPFAYHAWVEIKGRVVNDKPYMLEIYRVLERC